MQNHVKIYPSDATKTLIEKHKLLVKMIPEGFVVFFKKQEEFVAQLTHHLAEALNKDKIGGRDDNDDQGKRKIRWVQPHHVEAAMTAMGLSDVLEEALECIQQLEDEEETEAHEDEPPKKKRKKKKKGEFSAEMIAEQERLLAASRQKQS